jgi:hypothetical protein
MRHFYILYLIHSRHIIIMIAGEYCGIVNNRGFCYLYLYLPLIGRIIMFGIYTLPCEDSPCWIFIETCEGNAELAKATAHEFHTASGDFCTRAFEGRNEVIIPRENVVRKDVWA